MSQNNVIESYNTQSIHSQMFRQFLKLAGSGMLAGIIIILFVGYTYRVIQYPEIVNTAVEATVVKVGIVPSKTETPAPPATGTPGTGGTAPASAAASAPAEKPPTAAAATITPKEEAMPPIEPPEVTAPTPPAAPVSPSLPPTTSPVAVKPATLFVALGRTGDCSRSNPCGSLQLALNRAVSGSVIEMAPGEYPAEKLLSRAVAQSFAQPVVVRPPIGQTVTFVGVDANPTLKVYHPNLQFINMSGRNLTVYTYFSYDKVTFDTFHGVNVGFLVRNSGFTLTRSLLEGNYNCTIEMTSCGRDAVQVASGRAGVRTTNTLIEDTTIRDYSQGSNVGVHADCVQLFDTSFVTIRRNKMYNCNNSAIILSPGRGTGMNDILIESNFISGCLPSAKYRCDGGPTLDVRSSLATVVTVRSNTVGGTYLRSKTPSVTEKNNIFNWVSACIPDAGNNAILRWNKGLCSTFPAHPTSKVVAAPQFSSRDNGDLHITGPTAAYRFADASFLGARDFDSAQWCPQPIVGADETRCSQ